MVMTMSKTVIASDVVTQLEKHLGQSGKYYWKKYGLASGTPYCAAAVSASFADVGAKKYFCDGKAQFYVPTIQQWLHKNAKHVKLKDVKRGDIVIFTWSGNGYNKEQGATRDHIGFVRADSSGHTVFTIEGNTSGGIVAKRDRNYKYIYGIYRTKIPYSVKKEGDTSKKDVDTPLTVDGIFGVKTKKKMQKWLKVAEDGQVGAKTIKALQKKVGAKVDGIWGKETTKKLQAYLTKQGYKTTANGDFGTVTIKHLQQFLNKYFKEKKD
jgi:peptidoglycan hydrolase-like protein with peptidoglycan-binding domain